MEKALGQPIIVENVPGAGGLLGVNRVKAAEPDGYTLVQTASPHTTHRRDQAARPVDLLRDLRRSARPATASSRWWSAPSSA